MRIWGLGLGRRSVSAARPDSVSLALGHLVGTPLAVLAAIAVVVIVVRRPAALTADEVLVLVGRHRGVGLLRNSACLSLVLVAGNLTESVDVLETYTLGPNFQGIASEVADLYIE